MSISIALHTVSEIEVVNFEANDARQAFAVITFKDDQGNDTTAYIKNPEQIREAGKRMIRVADTLARDLEADNV